MTETLHRQACSMPRQARYRLSCDSCLESKVRCNQKKPKCDRCIKKNLDCSYTPFRRLGRPKKPIDLSSNTPDNTRAAPIPSRVLLEKSNRHTDLDAELESELDCHVAILKLSTRLELQLSKSSATPPMDIIFEAERDFCATFARVFSCTGHNAKPANLPLPLNHSFKLPRPVDESAIPCLDSERPILLAISMLGNRIVDLIELIYNMATKYAFQRDMNDQSVPWLGLGSNTNEGVITELAARRIQRSFRSMFYAPCATIVIDAGHKLRIGDFELQAQVKARAIRRLLLKRVRKLLERFREIKRELDTRRGMQEYKKRHDHLEGGPLGWSGSQAAVNKSATVLVADVVRRLEALQGTSFVLGNSQLI